MLANPVEAVEKVPKTHFPSHSREGGSLFLLELWIPASTGMTWFRAFSTTQSGLEALTGLQNYVLTVPYARNIRLITAVVELPSTPGMRAMSPP